MILKLKRLIRSLKRVRLVSLQNSSDLFTIRKGAITKEKISLFSIFKDEMYFLNAFFGHYRDLGIEQFVIIDDGSTDGTLEFLLDQPDCVVLATDVGFNEELLTRFDGERLRVRRGSAALKSIVPHSIAPSDYVLYVDADEFLVLPAPLNSLGDLLDILRRQKASNVVASVIEMFPERFSTLSDPVNVPECFENLVTEAPYFECRPIVRLTGDGRYRLVSPTKTFSLFETHFDLAQMDRKNVRLLNDVRHKTPVMQNVRGNFRIDSHSTSMPVHDGIVLGLLHFIYTANLAGKLERVVRWRRHAHGGARYDNLALLNELMVSRDPTLLTSNSRRFRSREDLQECGIIRFDHD